MTGTMRVVLIGHDHPSSPSLIAGLEDYGCSIVPMTTDDANAEAIQAQGANAIVIRAGDSPLAATETARLLKAGKPATHLPIIIIGNVAKDKLDDDAIDGVVDDLTFPAYRGPVPIFLYAAVAFISA